MVLPYVNYNIDEVGAKTIPELEDVNLNNLADGEVLKYNATNQQWENGEAGGGATEILETNNLVAKLGTAGANLNSGATENILLGLNAGNALTGGDKNVCISSNAGDKITGGFNNVYIGENCGSTTNTIIQKSVAIGYNCCNLGTGGDYSTSIGNMAGSSNTGIRSVNIGNEAGRYCVTSTDGQASINIGHVAGRTFPKEYSINIGSGAGYGGTSIQAVNIGRAAGNSIAGTSSINLGALANQYNGTTHNQAIVINATGVNVPSVGNDTLVVKPIRNATGVANALFYDATSGEITYDTAGGGGTELVATNNLVSKLDTATSLTTGTRNIILGDLAGKSISTEIDNVFIGHQAGNNATISRGVAIGFEAGKNAMGVSAICIGQSAGRNNAGNYSIHIGFGAGNVGGNHSGCVVIVGGATTLNPNGANRCFMKPIRGVAHGLGVGVMKYDPATSELTYSTT